MEESEEVFDEQPQDIKPEIIDSEEQLFPIRYDESGRVLLELAYNSQLFHLMSVDGYVIFADKTHITQADESNYYVKQDDEIVPFNKEEYEMICQAIDLCKGM